MKKIVDIKLYWILYCIAISTISIAIQGCSKDESKQRTVILNIDSKTSQTGTIPESGQLVECMVAKEEGSTNVYYLTMKRIEGFEYEKGYLYRIKVKISPIKNPPMDGHTESFKLLAIISKTKVNVASE